MTILTRIYREPAAMLALVGAVLTVLTATGVLDQSGAAVALGVVTAAVGALRYLVTPATEVIAQRRPDGGIVLGDAYDGETVTVDLDATPGQHSLERPRPLLPDPGRE